MINNNFVFVFLVPLLYVLYTKDLKTVICFVLPAVLAASVITLLPVVIPRPGLYALGTAIVFSFLAIFAIACAGLMKLLKGSRASLFIPCIVWLSLLYTFNVNSMAASAFDIGVLFPISAPLIWFTGSIGLTALLILFQSAATAWMSRKDAFSLIVTASLAAIFLGSFIFSSVASPVSLHDRPEPEKVALIQGGLPSRSIFGYKENFNERIKRYVELSFRACQYGPDLVVWPEYVFPVDVINRFPEQAHPVIDAVKSCGRDFLIGSMLDDPDGGPGSYDGAVIIGKDGSIEGAYYSSHPFTMGNAVKPAAAIARLFLGGAGVTVCWEEVNEKIFRDYVNAGAEYFISLSSNVDLDRSWLKGYTSFFSRARAAENARYLARAAQTGATQIIDPFGRVAARIPYDKSAFLAGDIYKVRTKTFYSAHGDILARAFAAAGILALCVLMALKLISSRREALYGPR